MQELVYRSIGISCLIDVLLLILSVGSAHSDALLAVSRFVGYLYVPAAYVTILLSSNPHLPSIFMATVAVILQTFIMVALILFASRGWQMMRRAHGKEGVCAVFQVP